MATFSPENVAKFCVVGSFCGILPQNRGTFGLILTKIWLNLKLFLKKMSGHHEKVQIFL
jgi:hypothetical protein